MALRSREATRDIPVIILTAQMLSEGDVERCNRGVAAILSKGLFDAAETLKHIEAALAWQHTWLFVLNHLDEEVRIDLPAPSVDLLRCGSTNFAAT